MSNKIVFWEIVIGSFLIAIVFIGGYFLTRTPPIENKSLTQENTRTELDSIPEQEHSEQRPRTLNTPSGVTEEEKKFLLSFLSVSEPSRKIFHRAHDADAGEECYPLTDDSLHITVLTSHSVDVILTDQEGKIVPAAPKGKYGVTYERIPGLVSGGLGNITQIYIPGPRGKYTVSVIPGFTARGADYTLISQWSYNDVDSLVYNIPDYQPKPQDYPMPESVEVINVHALRTPISEKVNHIIRAPVECYYGDTCLKRVISFTTVSPAREAGVNIGDFIFGINGESFTKDTLYKDFYSIVGSSTAILNTDRGDVVVTPRQLTPEGKPLLGIATYPVWQDGCK